MAKTQLKMQKKKLEIARLKKQVEQHEEQLRLEQASMEHASVGKERGGTLGKETLARSELLLGLPVSAT